MTAVSVKQLNPFRPGAGIEPLYIAGRESEYQTFERLIRSAPEVPANLIISGLRGTGKTVLLRDLRGICEDHNWLYVGREFNERFSNEQDFNQAVTSDVLTKIKGLSIAFDLKEIGGKVFEVLRDSAFTYKDLSVKLGKLKGKDLLEDFFLNLLNESAEIIRESGVGGLVFLYDEFHMIADQKSKKQFPLSSFLGALSQAQRDGAPFILVATGLPQIQTNFIKAKSYSERMFRIIKLTNLSQEDAKKAFVETLKNSDKVFGDDLLDYLAKNTAGYPYFIQFYGYFIVENIPKDEISLEDVKEIEPLLLKELDASFFEARYNKASEDEKKLLSAIAEAGSQIKVTELESKKEIGFSSGTIRKLLSRLEEKGLIYRPNRGIYSFTVPLFREFLLRK